MIDWKVVHDNLDMAQTQRFEYSLRTNLRGDGYMLRQYRVHNDPPTNSAPCNTKPEAFALAEQWEDAE